MAPFHHDVLSIHLEAKNQANLITGESQYSQASGRCRAVLGRVIARSGLIGGGNSVVIRSTDVCVSNLQEADAKGLLFVMDKNPSRSRNAPCPCGSGLTRKMCHPEGKALHVIRAHLLLWALIIVSLLTALSIRAAQGQWRVVALTALFLSVGSFVFAVNANASVQAAIRAIYRQTSDRKRLRLLLLF